MQAVATRGELSSKLAELTKPVVDMNEAMLISAVYDGDLRLAVLKFYDPKAGRFWLWRDNTGHRPYCYTKQPREEIEFLRARKDVIDIVDEEKLDMLADEKIEVRKIITTDPLAIGGGNDSIRDRITAWEADIKYYENYAYDKGLKMGTYYRVANGRVVPVRLEVSDRVSRSLDEILKKNTQEFAPYIREWAELLGQPLCEFRRVAMDIEVANEEGRLPDPEDPTRKVISVSFFSDSEQLVYALRKPGPEPSPAEYSIVLFDDTAAGEAELLRAVFSKMLDYPVVLTFNGDNFDLRYLKHRAERLKIPEDEDPIELQRVESAVKHGVHIDLYNFFKNRSIQVYAFNNKYSDYTLNTISEALIGKSKVEFEGNIADLPMDELARYNLNDSRLTYELTTMMDSVVMKLLTVISRIAKMPINDVGRLGVSNWIRSMLFYEHRRMGALIPRTEELAEKGGASSQAIIKGKKYKGGLVIEPKPGVFFDVSVLDFASLVYDEPIFLRKRQTGQICKKKIGEFVENLLPGDSSPAAKQIGPTWDVLSFDYDKQHAAWKTVTAVIRHPKQEDVLEVETESGRRVVITKGHSLITLGSDGTKETIKGGDLRVGDYLVALSSFAAEQYDTTIDLLPYLREIRGFEITRGAKGKGSTVVLRSKKSHRRFVIQRFLPMTEDLAWGLGYWMAEGWLDVKDYRGSLAIEADSDDINLAQSKFEASGFRTWKSDSKTPGCSNLGVGGRYVKGVRVLPGRILAALVKLWFGDHARTKSVPDWTVRLPVETRRAFIDGYYKGDGYSPNELGQFVTNGKFRIGSYSQTLVNGLMSLGLVTGLHCLSKNLEDRESYLTWSSGAKTYSASKRPPAELLARSEHVRLFAKTPYYASHRLLPPRYERVRKDSVAEYQHSFENFYRGDCHFERVVRVTEVRNTRPVYDISVRGSESFFTADGILVSNSLYPSLIKVYNLSYETVDCGHEECRKNTIPDTSSWVCTRRKGIISLVVGSLRDLRVGHYKPLTKDPSLSKADRELYSVVTQGLKVFLNASYGVLGFETFAFYCLPVAEATAALGRFAITKTIAKCQELGIPVLYGDSVTGERCVTLLDPSGHLRVMPIEELFSQFEPVRRPDGKEEGHTHGWKALSMDPDSGAVDFKPVTAVIRHRTRKKVYRVWQKWGCTRVTEDHSLLVENRGKLEFSAPTALRAKSLVRARGIPDSKQVSSIDVYEMLKPYAYQVKYKGREKRMSVHTDGESVWYGWTNRKKKITVKRTILVGSPEFESLVRLFGAYVAEGSSSTPDTTTSRMGASIACSDTEWLTQLRDDYLRIFNGTTTKLVQSTRQPRHLSYTRAGGQQVEVVYADRTQKIQMMNELAAVFFKAFCGQKSTGKAVPDFIFNVPAQYKRLFLENMVKGDGSRVFGPRYSNEYAIKNFRYETKSNRLASGLAVILTQLGIGYAMGYRPSKSTYWFSTSSTYNRRWTDPVVVQEGYDGYVYDLSVEDFHTFVDSCGGVVLKNTDSIFLKNPSKEQIATVTRWADGELGVELDLDKTYRYVAFSSRKKNYFGVLPDGTVDIKGLTGKKSVLGGTPIIVRVNGETVLTDVKSAYKWYGEQKQVEILTISNDLTTLWLPISDASQHTVDEIYRVETSKGRRLTLSGDHSVYNIDSFGRLHHKPTRDLKQGDVLVGARLVPRLGGSTNLSVLDHLNDLGVIKRGMVVSSNPHSTTGVPIPARLPLSPDLGFLLGIYTAEGNSPADPHSRGGSISQNSVLNSEVCREIEVAWKRTFCWEVANLLRKKSQRRYYLPVLYAQFFGRLCGGESKDKRVPSIAFDAPEDFVASYLRGLFSGDGYGDGRRVNMLTKSETLASGVAYLLAFFDIDCRIRIVRHSRYGPYYQVSIIGADSRKTFYERIGFLQKRFSVTVGTRPRNKELLPIKTDGLLSVKRDIVRSRDIKMFRQINFHDSRYYNLSLLNKYNSVIGKLLEHAEPHQKALLTSIATMLNRRDVSYDEVVSVTRLRGSCTMYDFSVPEFARFVAGNLPTLLHNSQTPEFLKQTFYQALDILSKVQSPDDFNRARASIRDLLTRTMTSLRDRRIPVPDLAFNVMMGKPTDKYDGTTPQHVRAAQQLEKNGKEIKAGDIIAYVKTKTPPFVKPVELAKVEEVDVDKYLEYARSMFDQMLDALDFSFDEIMGATTLDFFWSG